ncbi:adenosine monophosphate-protein transferase SoFic [Pedobacter glucosidilyticus]|uniref:Fic family protein n=1 Tax=Pedobacter aquae TaxID=2605747 RepID=A0A5C0VHV7_9SPHI|nr:MULTISPECIES: Fic family protein [Pedobacter]KHJ39077.1 adenosine monophosphate-protein transferase SoFic [Pedobacter glucosidilyticus]QEK52255.1 Fic family protein [Pedobacter aquae]
MSRTIEIIDQLWTRLEALKPIKPEYKTKLDKKFRLEFNFNSNHLEGNTLTYGETELLLIFDDTKGNHTLREYEEMKAHDVAYLLVEEWAQDKESPLIEQKIKNLNEIILVRPFWKEAITPDGQNTRRLINIGNYKNHPNSVRLANGEIFHYTSPTDTPFEMQDLIKWYAEGEDNLHPVKLAAMLHYKFVRIHPFDDGNGRVSRLLMNYVLLKHNYPPIIIKSADKQNYLRALHLADVGDYEPFIEYISQQVKWSLEISIKAAKGETIDEQGDLEKKISVLKKKLKQDKEVKLKFDNSVLEKLVKKHIFPLAYEWEKGLKKFDQFFFSREVALNTEFGRVSGMEINEKLTNNFLNKLLLLINNNQKIIRIRFSSSYRKLKSVKDSGSFNGGFIEIQFHQNAYEISYSGSKTTISKLYDEELTKEEMESITNSIGNWFYTQIENAIELYNK